MKGKKLAAALARRRKSYLPEMPSGQRCHQPGSQNVKKGYGSGSRHR